MAVQFAGVDTVTFDRERWIRDTDRIDDRSTIRGIMPPGEVPLGVRRLLVSGSWTSQRDADVVGVVPRTHQPARRVEITAVLPAVGQAAAA